jgi:RNA polymerase sigma-70 factor (ECF subfamily)
LAQIFQEIVAGHLKPSDNRACWVCSAETQVGPRTSEEGRLILSPVNSLLNVEQLIEAARCGSREALGRLFDTWRPYLLLTARQQLPAELNAKLADSDVVQETFLKAHREFPKFRGSSQGELLTWLHRILSNSVANQRQHYLATDKRQVTREISLTDTEPDFVLPDEVRNADCPCRQASDREEEQKLNDALQRLPMLYRVIIRLRNEEHRSFAEIGQVLDRSPEASRKLWLRALDRLTIELGGNHESV